MNRRSFLKLSALIPLAPLAAVAQQRELKLIGMIGPADEFVNLFQEGLAEQGWVVGQNVLLERRTLLFDASEIRHAVEELVAMEPDLLFGLSDRRALALADATSDIPIVFANVMDPVRLGLAANLAQPERNSTGFMFGFDDWAGKAVQLLLQAVPEVSRLGFLVHDLTNPNNIDVFEDACIRSGVEGIQIAADDSGNYRAALSNLTEGRTSGLVVDSSVALWADQVAIVDAIVGAGIPASFAWREYVELGGLMSYGPDVLEQISRAGAYAGRILNGAIVSELPIQASTQFQLVLNAKAAAELGVSFPTELIATANEIID